MSITLHKGDLPDNITFTDAIAVDTETMGLQVHGRDRLCVVQISAGDGTAHLVQIAKGQTEAPNLKKLMSDPNIVKIFHFARFDVAALKLFLGVDIAPVYCTKIASKLVRTYTDRHGLKELCRELISVDISKQQQSSDWGADELSKDQLSYAASDVFYLHRLKEKLDALLTREGRMDIAQECFSFLNTRADLDIIGWNDIDIFAH
ncbi:MAG: ribonuclease D [Pseudomonadota bacterium]|nr:ribonuclease D [Alphaproteobacteria bacterium]MEC7701390.1 ribonuclease D [Pseudomonadota bacterium]MEC9236525.1 ribonuclease D [Pseudomonadota bacterium]